MLQRRSAARRTAGRHSGKPQVQPPPQPRITDNSWPSQVDGLNRRFDKLTADLGKGEDTGAPLLSVLFGVRGTPSRMVVPVAPAWTARGLPRCGHASPLCSGHVSTGLQAHSGESGAGCRHTHGFDRYGHQEHNVLTFHVTNLVGPLEALIRETEAQVADTRADSGRLQRVWAARQTALAALQVNDSSQNKEHVTKTIHSALRGVGTATVAVPVREQRRAGAKRPQKPAVVRRAGAGMLTSHQMSLTVPVKRPAMQTPFVFGRPRRGRWRRQQL